MNVHQESFWLGYNHALALLDQGLSDLATLEVCRSHQSDFLLAGQEEHWVVFAEQETNLRSTRVYQVKRKGDGE